MLPSSFWRDFIAGAWQREPAVFRQAAKDLLASPSDVFEALLALAQRITDGDERLAFRFNRSGIPVENAEAYLPRSYDGTNQGYTRRMQRELTGDDFGIIVNDLQALSPTLWQNAAAFLDGLYAQVGVPAGGAIIDLFMGDYRRTFLGLHKDNQDVFTFVLEGKKTALLWPFETFQPRAPTAVRHDPFVLGHTDCAPYRDQAIVLEGEPGDLMYWPASFWHVIEGDGTLATTLSLGLFLHTDPIARLAAVRDEVFDDKCLPVSPPAPALRAIRNVLAAPPLQRALEERVLASRTSFGFKKVPDAASPVKLPDRTELRISEPCALAWITRPNGTITWSASGSLISTASAAIVILFERLLRGTLVSVKELRALGRSAGLSAQEIDATLQLLVSTRTARAND